MVLVGVLGLFAFLEGCCFWAFPFSWEDVSACSFGLGHVYGREIAPSPGKKSHSWELQDTRKEVFLASHARQRAIKRGGGGGGAGVACSPPRSAGIKTLVFWDSLLFPKKFGWRYR